MGSEQYPVLFDHPFVALAAIGVIDILLPLFVFYFASKIGKLVWLLHFLTFLFLIASPFILLFLVTSNIPADEASGPGDGFIVVPLIMLLKFEVPAYLITLLIITIRKFLTKPGTA